MFEPRTLKTLAVMLTIYGLLVLPSLFWPSYADSPVQWLLLVPGLSIYLFHKAGIPGLLEHDGLCGWGWCAPTPFGWVFLVTFWLAVTWLVAWGVATWGLRMTQRRARQ